MKTKHTSKLLVLFLALSLMLTGCSTNKADEVKDEKTVTQDKKGEEIEQVLNTTLYYEPDSLDVATTYDSGANFVLEQVMENLTRLETDENGKNIIKPAGAESWEVSKDQLEWTFHLRDFNWSDGVAVKASDYEYGVKRVLAPETGSPTATFLKPLKNAEKIINGEVDVDEAGIEAIDDKTLKITLEYPIPYLLDLTASREMQPQRKDIIEKHGDEYGSESDTLVFNGPFVIDEWAHNSKVVFTKNNDYWDKDSVKLNKIVMKIIGDTNALMGELQNGDVDMAEVSSAEWMEILDKDENLEKITNFLPRSMYMFFNQNTKLFSNAKVRQAFSLAIEREEIQEKIFQGIDKPGFGWIAPPITMDGVSFRELAGDPIIELEKENPDPKALLIEGLKELGLDEDPSKVTVKIMQPGESKTFGEYLQNMYKEKLGVNIELDPVEWSVFQERNRELDYEMGYKSWGVGFNDPAAFLEIFNSETTIVPTGWVNKEYNTLVKEATMTIDKDEKYEKFKKAEDILVKEDCTIAPYAYLTSNTYKQKYVKNLMDPDFGSFVFKYVYIEK